MRTIIVLAFLACLASGCATPHAKTRAPIWYLPAEDTAVYGVSVVYNPLTPSDEVKRSTTYGIRLDPIGIGFLVPPFLPRLPYVDEDAETYSSRLHAEARDNTYGLDLSLTGSVIGGNVYGVSAGLVAVWKNELHGISGAFVMNMARKVTGLQCSMYNAAHTVNGLQIGIASEAARLYGIQIGLINITNAGRGLQLGVWNVNKRRRLPLINWVSSSLDE